MGFIGRWLSDAIRLGLALALSLAAMQLPAVAQDYVAALAQVAGELRRDIAQRETTARQYYNLGNGEGAGLVEALRGREPANADALENSQRRAAAIEAAQQHIAGTPALLRPVVAIMDGIDGGADGRRDILLTALDNHEPGLVLNTAGATYGLVGLLLGTLLAQIILAPFAGRRRAAHR